MAFKFARIFKESAVGTRLLGDIEFNLNSKETLLLLTADPL